MGNYIQVRKDFLALRMPAVQKLILIHLAGKTDGWTVDPQEIAKVLKLGRDAVHNALRDLRSDGWITKPQSVQGDDGKWAKPPSRLIDKSRIEYKSPGRTESLETKYSVSEYSVTEYSVLGNSVDNNNNDIPNTNKQRTDVVTTPEVSRSTSRNADGTDDLESSGNASTSESDSELNRRTVEHPAPSSPVLPTSEQDHLRSSDDRSSASAPLIASPQIQHSEADKIAWLIAHADDPDFSAKYKSLSGEAQRQVVAGIYADDD